MSNSQLGPDIEIGSIRELFFIQSVFNSGHNLFHSKSGDYQVDQMIFEIGGKNKTRQQIKGINNAFIVKDDIIMSSAGVIPLIYFGFLY